MIRVLGDFDLAEEAVQDAFLVALEVWPARGLPRNPGAWITTTARNKAIDRIRRARRLEDKVRDLEALLPAEEADEIEDSSIPDDRLRLIFTCCHPALAPEARVAMTLRTLGGLQTPEIARAFLTSEQAMQQRLVRAKRKIRDARIPLSLPADLTERLGAVLTVLYLVFNEGYLSRGGSSGARSTLMDEAIRLSGVLVSLAPDEPEIRGLLALELFHRARTAGRFDAAGDLVLLEEQDRSTWDLAMITRANRTLATALTQRRPGVFQIQALIGAQHANARTATDTDWPAIARLYGQLAAMTGSPVVALNHAVAVGMADGPDAGLRMLARIDGPAGYHLLPAARAELLVRAGRSAEAIAEFDVALRAAPGEVERRHLERRRASVAGGAGTA